MPKNGGKYCHINTFFSQKIKGKIEFKVETGILWDKVTIIL